MFFASHALHAVIGCEAFADDSGAETIYRSKPNPSLSIYSLDCDPILIEPHTQIIVDGYHNHMAQQGIQATT